jgi:hypothetical protein
METKWQQKTRKNRPPFYSADIDGNLYELVQIAPRRWLVSRNLDVIDEADSLETAQKRAVEHVLSGKTVRAATAELVATDTALKELANEFSRGEAEALDIAREAYWKANADKKREINDSEVSLWTLVSELKGRYIFTLAVDLSKLLYGLGWDIGDEVWVITVGDDKLYIESPTGGNGTWVKYDQLHVKQRPPGPNSKSESDSES